MSSSLFEQIAYYADRRESLPDDLALAVLRTSDAEVPELLRVTNKLRRAVFGDEVRLCSIINARSGICGEDCAFCAQATCHQAAPREIYPMRDAQQITAAHAHASQRPIHFFSIVTSGGRLSDTDRETALHAIQTRALGAQYCASLGLLSLSALRQLKQVGVVRYHHNLETAESFYPSICTTHTFQQRVEVIRLAHQAGLKVCSGGILGLGESLAQRVELARALAELRVEGVPLNFLIPVPGTPLERRELIRPTDALRAIAMFRLVNPEADLRVAGGREHLGSMQSMIFYAGCTGMMIGELLTTSGQSVDDDIAMVKALGLKFRC